MTIDAGISGVALVRVRFMTSTARCLRLLPVLAGAFAAAGMGGCVKRAKPELAMAQAGAAQPQNASISGRDDVARRWAAAYAANPRDSKAALGYARALKSQGLTEQALDVLKRAYEATKDPELASELGRLAMEKGDLVAAAPALDAALAANPGDWRLLSAQGALHARKGDHKKAQDRFLAALAQNPGQASIINNLALSYAMDGKKADAERLLRTALQQGSDDRMKLNLARIQSQPGAATEVAGNAAPQTEPAPRSDDGAQSVAASAAVPEAEAAPAMTAALLRPRID
jgi:Flp pilus assembly protein TadD